MTPRSLSHFSFLISTPPIGLKEADLRKLAGNAFSGFVFGAVAAVLVAARGQADVPAGVAALTDSEKEESAKEGGASSSSSSSSSSDDDSD